MFRLGDKVHILKGMMMDVGATAEVVGYVSYKVCILNRDDYAIREIREDELELIETSHSYSWPPTFDDGE